MIIWNAVVLLVCKTVYFVLRKTGSHGAALPGLIAEKLDPGLLSLLTELPEGIIVLSGTNGKTTTTHLLASAMRRMGKRVFTNHSGSNMTRGLLASIVRYASLSGRLPYDVAVLEIDEAYAAKLAPILQPRACILTNVLRDQLDRFGEIDQTAKLLYELAEHTRQAVVFNAADSRLVKIGNMKLRAAKVTYGFHKDLAKYYPDDDSLYGDADARPARGYAYTVTSRTDAQIRLDAKGTKLTLQAASLPGWHNALNLTAVTALLSELYAGNDIARVLQDLSPPYGRGEKLRYKDSVMILQLVKNPGGFHAAMAVAPELPALIAINDAHADSRDVSWLWDVDVSALAGRPGISAAGTRAYDMAVRLKYAGIKALGVDTDYKEAVEDFCKANRSGVIFLTYTAMLGIRKYMLAHGGTKV